MSTRTNIRTATANALTGALVVPTANILRGRNNTIASISFPAAAVYAVSEQIEVRTLGPSNRTQYRQLQLIVVCTIGLFGKSLAHGSAYLGIRIRKRSATLRLQTFTFWCGWQESNPRPLGS